MIAKRRMVEWALSTRQDQIAPGPRRRIATPIASAPKAPTAPAAEGENQPE